MLFRRARRERTAGEEDSSNRFTEARKMWRVYHRAIGNLAMWRVHARETGYTKSGTLFHSLNGGCFRPGTGVWAFKTFRFSVETLDTAVITGVERASWSVTLHWENNVDCSKAS